MREWIRDLTKFEWIIIAAIIGLLWLVTCGIWWKATHTCIEWEKGGVSGRNCLSRSTIINNGVTTSHCNTWEMCRKCLKFVDNDEVRRQIVRPEDACP